MATTASDHDGEAHQGQPPEADPREGTPELVMHELRDLRKKQDRQLDGLRRLAGTALIVVLTTGTIAVAVNTSLAAATAVIILAGALIIGVGLALIELFARNWSDGPKIDPLIRQFREEQPTLLDLQLVIIKGIRTDHTNNKNPDLDCTLQFVRVRIASSHFLLQVSRCFPDTGHLTEH